MRGWIFNGTQEKNCERKFGWTTQKVQLSPYEYRCMEWTDRTGDNGKEFITKTKTGQI